MAVAEPVNLIRIYEQRIDELNSRLLQALKGRLDRVRSRLALASAQLRTLNPRNTLDRGYSILVTKDDAAAVTKVSQVVTGQSLTAILADGQINLRVE